MISDKAQVMNLLNNAVAAYDRRCKDSPAGTVGVARKASLIKLLGVLNQADALDLTPILQFYQTEKRSGWFTPRLVKCLKEALFLIFQIPASPAVPFLGHRSALIHAGVTLELYIARQQKLKTKIETYLNENNQPEQSNAYHLSNRSDTVATESKVSAKP